MAGSDQRRRGAQTPLPARQSPRCSRRILRLLLELRFGPDPSLPDLGRGHAWGSQGALRDLVFARETRAAEEAAAAAALLSLLTRLALHLGLLRRRSTRLSFQRGRPVVVVLHALDEAVGDLIRAPGDGLGLRIPGLLN